MSHKASKPIDRLTAQKSKVRFAFGASKVITSQAFILGLKNYVLTAICTIGAYAVRWLVPAVFLAERVHEASGVPLVKRVARKFIITCFLLIDFQKQLTQLNLELSIRQCRIAYLRSKLGNGGIQITVCSRLRFLEKTLDGSGKGHPSFRRGKRLASDFCQLAQSLEVKIAHGAPMKHRGTPPKVAVDGVAVNEGKP
ncbi:hypothetical protein [Pseudophaeobacter sp. EL27]|uniref:hypothetical protein n=1 Tax=Pseudophaeobacter sp. EL27 TaxID=2107580 RepID=UPI000EFA3F14|nr:hypothetical protein [Pseudophaeobacter sp. EL27]